MEGYFYDRILLYYNGKMCTEFLWLETRTIASRCGHFNVVSGYVKCGVSPQSNFGIVSQIKPPLNSSPLHNPLIILSSDFIQYKQIQAPRINNIFKKKTCFHMPVIDANISLPRNSVCAVQVCRQNRA